MKEVEAQIQRQNLGTHKEEERGARSVAKKKREDKEEEEEVGQQGEKREGEEPPCSRSCSGDPKPIGG